MPSTTTDPQACRKLATALRAHCLRMTHRAKSAHIGSMLSMADVLAVLYERIIRVDPDRPKWSERDRFVLSKGHAGGALYAVLAEKGFFPKDWLDTYYMDDSLLLGHVSHYVPGVDCSTGSLGHGLSIAAGMALDAKLSGRKNRVFCIMSEGDVDEGSTYEAVMFAAQQKLDNLVAIFDYNKIQSIGHTPDVLDLEPLTDRIEACRWSVGEVDGHDHEQIEKVLKQTPFQDGRPSWITAHTVKAKGVSFLENKVSCHYHSVTEEELAQAMQEIGAV